MAVTVQDVADSAGVSPATVSRVLNKRPDITPKTRTAVENAIRQLGYQRSATNRGRRVTGKKPPPRAVKSLVLLIPDTHIEAMLTPLTGQIMHGTEAVARKHGYHFLLSRLSEEDGLSPTLSSGNVDGMIVRSNETDISLILPAVPIVWVFNSLQPPTFGDMVFPDNQRIGQMAARYLLDRGHTHLAVIDALPHHPEAKLRAESFQRLAESAGASVDVINCIQMTVAQAAEQLLAGRTTAIGVFLPIGDDSVEQFVRAVTGLGLQMHGGGLNLISCNNDVPRLRALDPSLPNIDIQAEEIGRVAAETLLWRLSHPLDHRRLILIEPSLVPGN